MQPSRLEKFRRVAASRQPGLAVVLENVTDWHNIGAVLRSCDSVGIPEIFVLHTEPHLQTDSIVVGKRTSMGTRKWVDVHYYTDPAACFAHVRRKCGVILSTSLGENSTGLHDLDLAQPTAFLFGNEHDGISGEVKKYADGNFTIPQVGMAESLNISVACAVALYEAYRQRKAAGFYDENPPQTPAAQEALFQNYLERHEQKERGRMVVWKKNP